MTQWYRATRALEKVVIANFRARNAWHRAVCETFNLTQVQRIGAGMAVVHTHNPEELLSWTDSRKSLPRYEHDPARGKTYLIESSDDRWVEAIATTPAIVGSSGGIPIGDVVLRKRGFAKHELAQAEHLRWVPISASAALAYVDVALLTEPDDRGRKRLLFIRQDMAGGGDL